MVLEGPARGKRCGVVNWDDTLRIEAGALRVVVFGAFEIPEEGGEEGEERKEGKERKGTKERKGREGKGREGKGRKGKRREGKGRKTIRPWGALYGRTR